MSVGYSIQLSADQHNNLACPVTSTIGSDQGELMSSSPVTPIGRKRPRTRLKTRRAKGEIAEGSEDINHIQQEIEIPNLTDSTSDEE